jgi:hypothetical protein
MTGQEDVPHQGLEPFALMPLAAGQMNAHDDAVLFDQQMHLGAKPSSGVAQRMI